MFSLDKIEDLAVLKEQINKRCSKRKFTGTVAEETRTKLQKFMETINSL